MRTTVTLEKDVERMLRDAMHRSRKSFKETLNDAVRSGLATKPLAARSRKFRVKAKPMGLKAGFDPSGFNRLVDELEVESFVDKRQGVPSP